MADSAQGFLELLPWLFLGLVVAVVEVTAGKAELDPLEAGLDWYVEQGFLFFSFQGFSLGPSTLPTRQLSWPSCGCSWSLWCLSRSWWCRWSRRRGWIPGRFVFFFISSWIFIFSYFRCSRFFLAVPSPCMLCLSARSCSWTRRWLCRIWW